MKYWFEKKEKGLGRGWGLFPINWKGHLLMFIFLIAVVTNSIYWAQTMVTTSQASLGFIFVFLILTMAFWMIAQSRLKK